MVAQGPTQCWLREGPTFTYPQHLQDCSMRHSAWQGRCWVSMATDFFSAQVNISTETPIDASQCGGRCPLLLHPSRLPSASEPRAGRLLWAPAGFHGPLSKASPHTLAGRGRGSSLGLAVLGVKPGHPQPGSPSSERGSNRAPPLRRRSVLPRSDTGVVPSPFSFLVPQAGEGQGLCWRASDARLPALL